MKELNISLRTRDGATIDIRGAENSSVLGAAEAAGYFLPAICHEGSCGLCHARVTKGAYEMGAHSEAALSHADAAQGGVLLCRCTPQEDLVVELPYNEGQVSRQKIPVRVATIESLEPAWAGAMALTLRLQPDAELGTAADFSPGQYMELTIPGSDVRRAYSLANLPNWEGRLDFLIRIQPNGKFSHWLTSEAKVGDTISVRGPVGNFILDETSPRPRVLVGGGCGIAPILSMLRHMGEFQDQQPVHLIFGANREAELVPASEVERLRSELPQLQVTLAVWRPEGDWQGFTGTTASALAQHLAAGTIDPDIYVCGPPKMLESIEDVARQHGRGARVIAERL